MKSIEIKVIENKNIAHNLWEMVFESSAIIENAKPGQFMHLKIPDDNSILLRRPFSINSIDKNKGHFSIVYQIVGKGTEIMSKVEVGSFIDILGPLGNGFLIDDKIKNLFLIGGGCGVAPLRFAGEFWKDRDIYSFLGYRNAKSIYQLSDFEKISKKTYVTTDDGSFGAKGSVIDLFLKEIKIIRPDMIFACGPIPMLSYLQKIVNEKELPCLISLEERMGCGIGACSVCSCKVGIRESFIYKKVCIDGPVFSSDEVILDDFS